MVQVAKENVLAARDMYVQRFYFLRSEISRIVKREEQLGEEYEEEAMLALDEIENEIAGIDECLVVLKHLLCG
jgi:outer membrane protein assembly factor BamD (BamD/ComL family)